MKKKATLILVIALSLMVTGCSSIEGFKSKEESNIEIEEVKEKPIPESYILAKEKAERYSETLHMSKVAIYEQLISDDGERFYENAAEYAIENMEVDWNENALKMAELYVEDMSITDVYEKLTSEDGLRFTKEEAEYVISNLK